MSGLTLDLPLDIDDETPKSGESRLSPLNANIDKIVVWQKDPPKLFREECHKDPKIYRNILFFIFLPATICVYFNNEHDHRRPKFVEFTYMRIRNKQYVWDPVRTLFHNPRLNALPTGYEEEVPEDEEYDPFDAVK